MKRVGDVVALSYRELMTARGVGGFPRIIHPFPFLPPSFGGLFHGGAPLAASEGVGGSASERALEGGIRELSENGFRNTCHHPRFALGLTTVSYTLAYIKWQGRTSPA